MQRATEVNCFFACNHQRNIIIMKNFVEIAVIGGGVIGTAITYYLAKAGFDVCLIERNGIAEGTSGRCDGRVIVYDQVPGESCRLAKMSLDLFPQLPDELGFDIGWSQEGTLLLMESEAEYQIAESHCKCMAETGLPYKMLDYHQVHSEEPGLAENVVGGLSVSCDGSVNPMALAQGFEYQAVKQGATVYSNTNVLDIKSNRSNTVDHIITDQGTIRVKKIINAAGSWAGAIGQMVNLSIPIKPRQGQLIVTERTFPVSGQPVSEFGYIVTRLEQNDYQREVTPVMEKYGIAFALEPTNANNFLIGTSRYFTGFDLSSNKELLAAMAKRAIRFYPGLKDIHVIRSYAGLRPYAPDHLPIISDTEIEGFYIAAGHEGNGISMAPITGELIANMIGNIPQRIDIDPFRWQRFSSPKEVDNA